MMVVPSAEEPSEEELIAEATKKPRSLFAQHGIKAKRGIVI